MTRLHMCAQMDTKLDGPGMDLRTRLVFGRQGKGGNAQ